MRRQSATATALSLCRNSAPSEPKRGRALLAPALQSCASQITPARDDRNRISDDESRKIFPSPASAANRNIDIQRSNAARRPPGHGSTKPHPLSGRDQPRAKHGGIRQELPSDDRTTHGRIEDRGKVDKHMGVCPFRPVRPLESKSRIQRPDPHRPQLLVTQSLADVAQVPHFGLANRDRSSRPEPQPRNSPQKIP